MRKRTLLSHFYAYIRPFRGLFILGFLALLSVALGQLAMPLIFKSIVDTCIPQGDVMGMFLRAIARAWWRAWIARARRSPGWVSRIRISFGRRSRPTPRGSPWC